MIPWIQVYANLPAHRKTCRLRDLLALKSSYEAVGLLVCFWSWAAVNAVGGNLEGYSARDISDASGYKKSPDKFLDALIKSGFVDKAENGSLSIHDWEEHAALLMDSSEQQKKNTRERVRRYRERNKANGNAECNVTCNGCNAPTLPNLTLPNLTNTKADAFVTEGACASKSKMMFLEFWDAYPKKTGQDDAALAWGSVVTDEETASQIIQSLDSWKRSEQWTDKGGRFIPRAAKFLTDGYWQGMPATESNGGRELDVDEVNAVKRMMNGGLDIG